MRFILLAFSCLTSVADAQVVTREAAFEALAPVAAVGELAEKPEGLKGRVVAGYQGWFRAEGDGAGLGFQHYKRRGRFEPGDCTIDLWPDLTEFDDDEKFATSFQHADGRTAHVFSSIHPKTVNRHFSWMTEYGIDGAFVQRFGVQAISRGSDERRVKFENQKLMLCRDAAIRHKRCWVLMYDLSGMRDDDFERLAEDWKQLRKRMKLGTDPHDSAYLHLNGKPLVAIWGVGFEHDRNYSLEKTEWLIRLLKHNPDWGGMSIMLGVPYYWRTQDRDATDDPHLHKVLELADVISPWSIGRYGNGGYRISNIVQHQEADLAWCASRDITYLPVLFPGFSWKNLKGQEHAGDGIPRLKGKFLQDQFKATHKAGNQTAYLAMFDEIDEGTALFKCTNDPPIGASNFQTYEGLPSDYYLKLCGQGRVLLRGEKKELDDR
ncbi:MAG: glycoside hydrolase family 71/99-like protein [Rubripirellula sp.]|nr:glycoside hydrolase family 71/99-like protein [Rubripirellula sp.]